MKKNKRSTSGSSTPRLKKKNKVSAKKIHPPSKTVTNSSASLSSSVRKTSWLSWLDEYILLILCGFLFAFIPLYPKIPLADLIPGYIVRLRLEDLFVALTVGVFGIQLLRKKVEWKTPITWFIVAYAIIGILSTLSAVFITKTVPFELLHIGKTALHYFRYLEYFSLLFIAYAAIKKKSHVYVLLTVLTVTVLGISLYGYGQKYYYWPVYSTMNREFSKGLRLYLTEHARVQSTFGGHYDMAAYLVIALPAVLSWFYGVKKWKYKIPIFLTFLAGMWLMIMGSSRSSFGAFLVGIVFVILGFAVIQPTWKKKFTWFISRGFIMSLVMIWMFMKYGEDIYERLLQTLQAYPELHNTYHGLNDKRKNIYGKVIEPLAQKIDVLNLLPEPQRPRNGISTDELLAQLNNSNVLVPSDQRPSTMSGQLPSDVYDNIPDIIWVATQEGGVATVTAVEVPRTYSDTAQTHGLSLAIRLDTLWPRALQGFYTNPLLGTGYATLTKETVAQFTEAESTDNNFLRTLGETGLLGFISFYGVIIFSMFLSIKALLKDKQDQMVQIVAIGFLSASIGLLCNAIFIDVYAASKVAFTYWLFTGITLAVILKFTPLSSLVKHEK